MTRYRIKCLKTASHRAPKPVFLFMDGFGEELAVNCYFWLVQDGEGRSILVDTGMGGSHQSAYGPYGDAFLALHRGSMSGFPVGEGEDTAAQLRACGLRPDEIDAVILTHLHYDHIANIPLFTKADIYVNRSGWEAARHPEFAVFDTFPRPLLRYMEQEMGGQLRLVDDEAVILPGISVLRTGGHTRCSQAVLIETEAGKAAISGDVAFLYENFEREHPIGFGISAEESVTAIRRLKREADILLPGHDPAVLERYPDGWIGGRTVSDGNLSNGSANDGYVDRSASKRTVNDEVASKQTVNDEAANKRAETARGRLLDRIAVVTGGSRGIGRGISNQLAEAGAVVIVNYTSNKAAALEVVAEIQGKGGRAEAVQADVGVKSDVDRMMDGIEERYGRIDILVNNAGICPFSDFFAIDEETWRRTIDVNLGGTFFCSQRAAAAMRGQGGGAIVNISTVTATRGSREQVHYASSKGGINSLTIAMAHELGQYGIRVNAILCGGVDTDINIEQRAKMSAQGAKPSLPLQRAGLPADLGKAVLYLASPDAEWVTGALLAVDGGVMTM